MRSQVTEQVELFLKHGCKRSALVVTLVYRLTTVAAVGLTAYFGAPVAGAAMRAVMPLLQ